MKSSTVPAGVKTVPKPGSAIVNAALDKTKAEEEAAAKLKMAVEAEAAAAMENKERLEREARGNGEITVVYCENRNKFSISKGECTVEAIDEEMALTFVYPKSEIHLTQAPVKGNDWRTVDWSKLEARSKEGVFSGLLAGALYYAVVIEDGAEKEKYEAEQKERRAVFQKLSDKTALLTVDRQLSLESCSCIEGNPCATPECCVRTPLCV